jgi:hypothetical protein
MCRPSWDASSRRHTLHFEQRNGALALKLDSSQGICMKIAGDLGPDVLSNRDTAGAAPVGQMGSDVEGVPPDIGPIALLAHDSRYHGSRVDTQPQFPRRRTVQRAYSMRLFLSVY